MITCYRSNEEKQFDISNRSFIENANAEMNLIKVYPQEVRQTILGFGGAFTEAAAKTWSTMSEAKREQLMQAYFGV